MRRSLILFVLAGLVVCMPSIAGIVYNNGGPNQNGGNEMTAWLQSEDFTLTAPAALADVGFWDIEAPSAYTGTISWWVYTDSSGQPGTVLFSGETSADSRIATGLYVDGYAEYSDVIPISASLGAGTYHLVLHNGDISHDSRDNFYWETTNPNATPAGLEYYLPAPSGWNSNGAEHAFYLESGGVPEPATMLLVGGALLGLCAALRRRR